MAAPRVAAPAVAPRSAPVLARRRGRVGVRRGLGRDHPLASPQRARGGGLRWAWLLLWVGAPVSVVRGLRSAERAGPERMWQGSDRGAACIFFGCFTAAWFAALVGVLKQGDVGGFLAMCAFTAVFFTGFIAEFLRIVQRQTVWTDPL